MYNRNNNGWKGENPWTHQSSKTKPQRRQTLRKAYTKTEGIYYVFFKEDQKPVPPGILSRIIIQKKRGPNLATEEKDTPSNRMRAKNSHGGKVIPPTQTALFFYLEKNTQEKKSFFIPRLIPLPTTRGPVFMPI